MSYVTAIIPSLPSVDKEYLKVCVESLRESGFDGDIVVVTNGGVDMNPLVDMDIFGITKHLHTRQQGQCNAVNRGAESVEGDCKYLFVINSDMYFAPGWDKNLRFDYKCFSPNLVEPTNNPGSAAPFLKLDGGFTLDEFVPLQEKGYIDAQINHLILRSIFGDDPKAGDAIKAHPEEPGFNLPFFIDIELWRTIGGYDEKYDPWGSNSDTDLQTKINLAGVTPMRLRDVLVYHFSNKSGTFDGTHQDAWQQNWNYFDRKWLFNRDVLNSDVWYNRDMLPKDREKIGYKPDWAWKYLDA